MGFESRRGWAGSSTRSGVLAPATPGRASLKVVRETSCAVTVMDTAAGSVECIKAVFRLIRMLPKCNVSVPIACKFRSVKIYELKGPFCLGNPDGYAEE